MKQKQKSSQEEISEKKAIEILRRAFARDKVGFKVVLRHSRAVQKEALRIAKKNQRKGKKIDIPFLKTSSLLHDIGRSKCPPWKKCSVHHGVEGAKILRREKLFRHAIATERHLGAGITASEAKKIGLPNKNYVPRTIEEKILAHADKLIDLYKVQPFIKEYNRYKKELGKKQADRLLRLKKEVDA